MAPSGKGGPASLRKACQHSIKKLLIAKCGVSSSFPSASPAPGAWRGAISSARSPEGEGRRGPVRSTPASGSFLHHERALALKLSPEEARW